MSTDTPPETGGCKPHYGKCFGPPMVPGLEGPYGSPVPMAMPYAAAPPGSYFNAQRMMANSQPMSMVQMNPNGMPMGGPPGAGMPNPMTPNNFVSPPGVPGLPGMPPGGPGAMPGGPMGPMPGGPMGPMPGGPMGPMPGGPMGPMMPPVGGSKVGMGGMPDGGIKTAQFTDAPSGGVTPAQFASSSPVGSMFPAQRTQVYFGSPVRMKIYWYTQGADGKANYSTTPLETPGRYNFAQAAIYRLKLTNIPGRPALELYPTLEVVPTSPRTNEFLAHNSVPVDFTEDDFKQVVDRNYIVKVIYLPDPQNQDGAGAGPGEISSTQLEPGQDPIQEALRRGSILLVVRMGNIDQGLQHSPPMTSASPSAMPPVGQKPVGQGVLPFVQVPFNMPPITPGATIPPPSLAPAPAPAQLPPLNIPPPTPQQQPQPKPGVKPGEEKKTPIIPLVPPPSEEIKGPVVPIAPPPTEQVKPPVAPIAPPSEQVKPPVVPIAPPPNLNPGEEPRPPAPLLPAPTPRPMDEPRLPQSGPALPLPGVEKPGAAPIQPIPTPQKPAPATTSEPPIAPVPAVPVSNGKEIAPRAPAMPALPAVNLPDLPSMVDPLGNEPPPLPSIPIPPAERK